MVLTSSLLKQIALEHVYILYDLQHNTHWFKSLCSEQEIAAYTAENEKAKKRDMERYHVERAMRG